MEGLKTLTNIVIGVVIVCVVYSAFSLLTWLMRLIGICIGSCG